MIGTAVALAGTWPFTTPCREEPRDTVGIGIASLTSDSTFTETMNTDPDVTSAIAQMHDNFEVRRLLLVCLHIIVPALMLFAVTLLGQSTPLPGLLWLQRHAIALCAFVGIVSTILIGVASVRTHVGITFHSAPINEHLYHRCAATGLNHSGVSANFFFLLLLSLVVLTWLLLWSAIDHWSPGMPELLSFHVAAAVVIGGVGRLSRDHARVAARPPGVERAAVGSMAAEELDHRRGSVRDTVVDIVVVTTMAVTMFAAVVTASGDLGNVTDTALSVRRREELRETGVSWLAGYGFLVLLLSQRILLRLRAALGEHATELRCPRHASTSDASDAWGFHPLERTFMMYTLLGVLACFLIVIGHEAVRDGRAADPLVSAGLAFLYLFMSTAHYIVSLARERRRYRNERDHWNAKHDATVVRRGATRTRTPEGDP